MWQAKIARSLGDGFAGTFQEAWGVSEYINDDDNTVFVGLYGLPDFYDLWRHNGRKCIFWCGSDLLHFKNGYWLDKSGSVKLSPKPLATWIKDNCESWVENEVEAKILRQFGIEPKISPSFLGNVESFPTSFTPSENPKVYLSVSGGNYEDYGWDLIERIADKVPEITFYLYGGKWKTAHKNVIVRGRIPQSEMDREIRGMQCGLRLNNNDGFSEITAKSILWGQYPIVRKEFNYPYLDSFETEEELIELLKCLKTKKEANKVDYRSILNKYPWTR
jgi:hypothetical protein